MALAQLNLLFENILGTINSKKNIKPNLDIYKSKYLYYKMKYFNLLGGASCKIKYEELRETMGELFFKDFFDDIDSYIETYGKEDPQKLIPLYCGLSYIFTHCINLELCNGKIKLIIDGMNIARNTEILKLISSLTSESITEIDYDTTIGVIKQYIPLLLFHLNYNKHNYDAYITYQSNNMGSTYEKYDNPELPSTLQIYFLGIPCYTGNQNQSCYRYDKTVISNEADDVVCLLLNKLLTNKFTIKKIKDTLLNKNKRKIQAKLTILKDKQEANKSVLKNLQDEKKKKIVTKKKIPFEFTEKISKLNSELEESSKQIEDEESEIEEIDRLLILDTQNKGDTPLLWSYDNYDWWIGFLQNYLLQIISNKNKLYLQKLELNPKQRIDPTISVLKLK